ncbi:MAG TPA: nuclear transport factor 2 family protein [Solirubrobacterales bacterium]|jgi:ketosteroid isomerase-like protein
MSQENVETIRRAVHAFNERDVDAMLADWADDVEMRLVGGFADLMGTEFRGHEGVRRWFNEWVENVDVRVEIEEIHDAGERVVLVARAVGAGETSGAPVALRGGQIYSFRHGLVIGVDNYYEASEALEAAGLSE